MKTYVHLYNIAEFFLEWEVFETKVVLKIRHMLYIKYFFPKIVLFRLDHVAKYGRFRQATDGNKIRGWKGPIFMASN